MIHDVIAAVATAWGEGAISIVRVSGEGSVALVGKIFSGTRPLVNEPPRRMALGNLVDPKTRATVDRVLAVRFERGASYTGEESVEIHCHGGTAAVRCCIDMLLALGARVALPGEFTKRAYLSGRLDLAQAEAVLGVVRASSDEALRAAGRSLQGELSRRLRALMDELTVLRAHLEVGLDYPEEALDDEENAASEENILSGIREVRARVSALQERCRIGAMLKNGVRVAILGRPNVGKSSLLNALLGEARSIVTDVAGTTRDTVDAVFVHRGMPMCLVDTAGIRDASDAVERIGVERARAARDEADICLLVADASARPAPEDAEIARSVRDKISLLILNKSDLPGAWSERDIDEISGLGRFARTCALSARNGDGVDDLKDALCAAVLRDTPVSEGYAATERMLDALFRAAASLDEAAQSVALRLGADVTGSLLAEAAAHLAAPLGADASEELLDTVFSSFCIGK